MDAHPTPLRLALAHLHAVLLAALVVLGLDLATTDTRPDPWSLLVAAGLCLLGGLLTGAAWTACVLAPVALPTRLALVGRTGLAVAGAYTLADALGVFARMSGSQQWLALAALAASVAVAAGLLILALALSPRPGAPLGRLAALPSRVRCLAAAGLALAAAAAFTADLTFEVGGYEAGHLALRLVALLSIAAALFVGFEQVQHMAGVQAWTAIAVALCWGTLPFVAIDGARPLQHALHTLTFPATVLAVTREATDFDDDGYSGLLGGGDCAPFDARIHPGATDVPGNGLDENCRLGDARPRLDRGISAPIPRDRPPTSVVLITVDSLAAGRLGIYGGNPKVAPHLDHWAEKALRFNNAFTSGGWTTLALPSMFRGLYPRKLRWSRLVETNYYRLLRPADLPGALRAQERGRSMFMLPLEDPRRTLPQWLKRRGMETVAVVDDSYTEVLSPTVGGFPGFDRYHNMPVRQNHWPSDRRVTNRAIKELEHMGKTRFFMWVHYFGPHLPSTHHADLQSFGRGTLGAYDQEIHHFDRQLHPLLSALHRKSSRIPLVTILTSDHGEVVRAAWRGHGRDLSDAGLRIPMLIRGKRITPGVTDVPASLVDVMPTVLALTGTPGPDDMDGRDLRALLAAPRPRVLLSDTWRLRMDGRAKLDLTAAFDGKHKLTTDLVRMDTWLSGQDDAHDRVHEGVEPPEALRIALDEYLEQHGDLWEEGLP